MRLVDLIRKRRDLFTFKNHYGENKTMCARDIYHTVMQNSRESDYNWIASANELVKLCKDSNFPREYSINIEIVILDCFSNIESRVNRGGDKYIVEEDDVLAIQYCYDDLGRLAQSTDNETLKKEITSVRTRYLKEMISSAVNTATRGLWFYCRPFNDLKEELVLKNFVKYSMMEETFNIQDMYKEIYNETKTIFKEAANGIMFKTEERDEDVLNIVAALERCEESEDIDVRAEFENQGKRI